MTDIFLESLIILFCYATLWFVVSIIKKRNDLADVAWGLGYVLLCLYFGFTKSIHPITGVSFFLIGIWGLRLSGFIYLRNKDKGEDFRYLKWRKEWGRFFYVRSYLQVYLLQAFLLLVIISPVLFAVSQNYSNWSLYTLIGALIWGIGFYWQSVGDDQLRHFIQQRKSKEEVLQTGLWQHSRHPNYFGEVVMWWGIYIIIWPLPGSLWFVIGPITITLLIRFVSGVPMLEQRYDKNPEYQVYKTKVPALFPKLFK